MTDTTALRAIAERASVLMSGTKSNIPRNDLPGRKRLVGFLVPEEVAGLSTGLFLLDAVQEAVNALPALLDHIDAQARALEEARAALEPFVDWCDHAPADAADNLVMFELTMPQTQHVTITVGDLRSARAASQTLARQEGVEG